MDKKYIRIEKNWYILFTFLLGLIGGDRFLRGQTSMGMLRLFLTISIIGTIASLIWILVELIIGAINYSKFEQDFLFNENGKWILINQKN